MSTAKELTIIEKVKSDPTIIDVQNRVNEVIAIRQEIFQKGVHFGPPYKGAKNDTLLKPGATFLQQKYGLRELHERLETTIHVDPTDLSKSYIIIQDRCRIFDSNGVELAQADAACTTFEDKYLFRGGAGKVCPDCGGAVMKSKYPDKRTNDLGWYCRDCKANFVSTDERIAGQDTTKSVNSNPLNLLDTIVAMAQKRASVRSTIKATGVDALFSPGDGVTVDFYDDVFDGDDLTKAGEQLIQVVAKNAVISQNTAPSSDLQQQTASVVVDTPTAAETAKLKLGTPPGQTIAPKSNGKWEYDLPALMSHPDVSKAYPQYEHRANAIKKLHGAGHFENVANISEAVKLLIDRPDKVTA